MRNTHPIEIWFTRSQEIARLGNWEQDPRTGELWWSDQTYKLFGLNPQSEKMTFEKFLGFVHPDDRKIIQDATEQLINSGPFLFRIEYRITIPGQPERYLYEEAIVDRDLDGIPTKIFGIIQDITEKKILQQAQLQSTRLSALGEVVAGVAHEINNPINGVINYAQLLINQSDTNDKSNQILTKIIKEGSRVSNIVKNLLNFAQKDREEFSSLDLIDIVIEPLNLNSQFFKKDGIHIEIGVPDDLPKIYGNQMQLEQVVLNLLSNARHALNKRFPGASNEKFIVIEATSSSSLNGGNVQLRIKDYGCGVPKDHLDKIFNPFFTTKEAGVGTGLGMSVSHDILEKHGATISIDSQVNKFTMVTITFPVKSK